MRQHLSPKTGEDKMKGSSHYQAELEEPTGLKAELFELIWQEIKTWDINVPAEYGGYCGATGSHVMAIINSVYPHLLEKMMCCGNCKWDDFDYCPADAESLTDKRYCSKWELG